MQLATAVLLLFSLAPHSLLALSPEEVTGWTTPRLIATPPEGTSLFVQRAYWGPGGSVLLACDVQGRGRDEAALLRYDRHSGASYLFVPDTLSTCYEVSSVRVVRVNGTYYLVWVHYPVPKPDGWLDAQLVIGRITDDGIDSIRVLADSINVTIDAAWAQETAYIVAKTSYYGVDHRRGGFLLRLHGSQVERRALPQSEWKSPYVFCQDSTTVYVTCWSGFAIDFAETHDGGRTWKRPSCPDTHGPVQHPGVVVFPGDGPVLLWQEDRNGDVWPEVVCASTWSSSTGWGPVSEVNAPFTGRKVSPWPFSVSPVSVKGRIRRLYLIWEEKELATGDYFIYYAYFDGQSWSRKQPVLGGPVDIGTPAMLVDGRGVMHVFALGYVNGEDLGIFYTHSTSPITHVTIPAGGGSAEALLGPPRPNPFNGFTVFSFTFPSSGGIAIRILDVTGKTVRTIIPGRLGSGSHTIRWDGRDDRGEPLPSGVYLVRLEAGGQVATRKVVLVR